MKISFEKWHLALQGRGPVLVCEREIDNSVILANNAFYQLMKREVERQERRASARKNETKR